MGGPGNEKKRKAFASHLASTLSDDRPKAVKGFVIRQLQVCGGIGQASAIANFLADPDDHIYEYAAQLLRPSVRKRSSISARPTHRQRAAPRLTILQGLGVHRDKDSKDAFRNATKDEDLEIRLAGLWGLMRIASAEDADLLLTQSAKESGWGRIKATAYCLELAEILEKNGKKKESRAIYLNIKKTRTQEHEDYLRESADRGLARLK